MSMDVTGESAGILIADQQFRVERARATFTFGLQPRCSLEVVGVEMIVDGEVWRPKWILESPWNESLLKTLCGHERSFLLQNCGGSLYVFDHLPTMGLFALHFESEKGVVLNYTGLCDVCWNSSYGMQLNLSISSSIEPVKLYVPPEREHEFLMHFQRVGIDVRLINRTSDELTFLFA